MARENGIMGTVYITFVVEGNGEVTEVKKLRGIGGGCDEEAMRLVKAMPLWKPAWQNGKPARCQFNLPIKFTLR
jgi:protein TonB